jgi:hypothetical protein
MTQYIDSLMRLKKKVRLEEEPQVGDLVLISTPVTKRTQWPLGVITKLKPGLDNLVRNVEIRTSDGLITRSIRSLVVLRHLDELDQRVEDDDNQKVTGEDPLPTDQNDDLVEPLDPARLAAEPVDELCPE